MSVASARPTVRRLRRFGLTVAVGCAVLGAVSLLRGHTFAPFLLGALGAVLLAMALAAPRLLEPVEVGWLTLGGYLAWINTRVILTVLFYAAITPTGILVRPFRDPLNRRLHEARASYWVRRQPGPVDPATYRQQF